MTTETGGLLANECELDLGEGGTFKARLGHKAILELEHGRSAKIVGSIARACIEAERGEPRISDWVQIAYEMVADGSPDAAVKPDEIFGWVGYEELSSQLYPMCRAAFFAREHEGKAPAPGSLSSPGTDTPSESSSEPL